MSTCTNKMIKQAILSSIDSKLGVIVLDKNYSIVTINAIAEKITGLKIMDVIKTNNLESLQSNTDNLQNEKCTMSLGNNVLSVNIDIIPHEEEPLTVITFDFDSNCDLTDIYVMESEFNQDLLDAIHDGIVISNADGVVIQINKAYEFISGVTTEEFVGKHVEYLIQEGYFKSTMTQKVIATKESHSMMQTLRCGRTVMISGIPLFDKNNELWRTIVTVRDMSELEKLKNKLSTIEVENLQLKNDLNIDTVLYSSKMKEIFKLARMVAATDATVLITGESGVGKEVLTKFIHDTSQRKSEPFISINCGAIPETLLESELFGYEKGAFSGASTTGKTGLLDIADKGTFVFDEIAELPLALQAKLLRLLQNREFYRVGGTKSRSVDLRFIASTNKNLEDMIEEGTFRSDLFYRLNVININIPPISERKDEVAPLVLFFLKKFNEKYNLIKRIDASVLKIMKDYDWPGNIREIQNAVEHMVVTCPRDMITLEYIPDNISRHSGNNVKPQSQKGLKDALDEVEKEILQSTYKRAGDTRTTAKILGISQSAVVIKMKKHGLSCTSEKQSV